ncbi:hypothetical protein U9M48_025954 [Paspalum notatum var. saurae]|uniref:DUF1618 domain-containing protein n=1 Tax=Paspalum notatum var. saurae TaxID=547442 RepID=A0AAQ3WYB0_PASNO
MKKAHRRRRKSFRKHSPSPTTTHPGTEPSASPTPRHSWWTTDPSPPSPATGEPSWLILDRIVHRSRRRRGVIAGDATASEIARDCVGRPISASLRIAEPPAVSRLYLHWRGMPSDSKFAEPTSIAAHRNSILFRVTVPFEDSMWRNQGYRFPCDYFVYSCSSSPSLTRLPPCFDDGGRPDPVLDKLFQPYRRQQQRTLIDQSMGILCHGDKAGEFTVANLWFHFHQGVEAQLCLLHHPPPAASSHVSVEWSVKKVQIPSNMNIINLDSWQTDVVVPIGGRCLCWVDYYQGMLLLDVLTATKSSSPDQQQLLHYIQFPSKALRSRRVYMEVTEPDPLRCLSVSDAGIITLVCIITKEQPSPSYPFTITTWTLIDIQHGRWEKDPELNHGSQSVLPSLRCPELPSTGAAKFSCDVVCFLLEDRARGLFWTVQADMREKLLQSSAIYINEEEEEGYPPKRARRNRFFGHYFIPSKFSSYLSEDDITSLEHSGTMQKEKEARVVLKCGLEAQANE